MAGGRLRGPKRGPQGRIAGPAADLLDSVGPEHAALDYEVRSRLVAEVLIEVAHEMAAQGGASRTVVVVVVGSDRRLTFSVPNALARRSTAPVVMVP